MAKKSRANAAEMRVQPDHVDDTNRARARVQEMTTQVEVENVDDIIDPEQVQMQTHGTTEELERCVVERGRTVIAPIEGKRRIVGWDKEEKKQVYGPVMRAHGPGSEMMLPKSEVKRLRETGHLVDPNRVHKAPSEHIQLVDKNPPEGAPRITES